MPRKKVADEFLIDWSPVSVRFTRSEHDQIKRAAKRRGISINTFIRQASEIGANKVLEAASADEEMRRIILAR